MNNSLAEVHPELVSEWSEKNMPLKPDEVNAKSRKQDLDCQQLVSGITGEKKFLMLTYSHIEYVLHCMSGNTTKVKNIKKYLLAALFNAPSTMNGYYQAEVNHDMPGLVR